MKLTKIVALTALAASFGAQAASTSASTSTTGIGSIYQQLKESPLSLDLLTETATARGTDGFTNTSIGYLGYKLTDVDSLKLENRMTFNQVKGSEDSYWSRTVLSYNRGKILTQAENGINLSAKIEQRFYPSETIKDKTNQTGLTRISAKTSYAFNDLFSVGATLYAAKTQRIDKNNGKTTDSYVYGSFSENFQINDKWYVSFIQEPYIGTRVNGTKSANIYNVVETGYQVTPELLAAVYTANTLTSGGDNDKLSISNMGEAMKGQEFAFYLYLNAF
tara:strand:- start:59017 stop:59847 length:831 start_codon:yes stop_codon:yes gene_type:complete